MSTYESGDNNEHLKLSFWLANMEAQLWEMKESAVANDIEHFLKELADCALVALDGIRLLAHKDALHVFLMRFIENAPKFSQDGLARTPRNTEYYLKKIEQIKAKLGVQNPCKDCPQCGFVHLSPTTPCGSTI